MKHLGAAALLFGALASAAPSLAQPAPPLGAGQPDMFGDTSPQDDASSDTTSQNATVQNAAAMTPPTMVTPTMIGPPPPPMAFMPRPMAAAPGGGALTIDLASLGPSGQSISIPKGKSAIVDLPVDARDVLVTNPKTADAVLRSPREIYVLGLDTGQTDAVFFDGAGRRILALNIRVDQDFTAVADTIARLLPGSRVQVEGLNNSLVLTGSVANAADADKALQIAQQFTGQAQQVLNMMTIAGKDQVMLKVRIVEVDRSLIKQLGVNLSTTIGSLSNPQFIASSAAGFGVNGGLLGGAIAGEALDTTSGGLTTGSNGLNKISGSLEAYEQAGIVRTLAEPTLTSVSGEAARFLAGGEFPVPTGEDNTGRVTIQFKPYGVGLGFTPQVLSNGRISLKVSTEVSELTSLGSFSLSAGTGTTVTVPGLQVRRAQSVVELPSGGAMMIAGLLKEETKQDIDSLPGLMNLPVLGALFRSRDYQEGETELVVIVTPYLVTPTNPANLQTPSDGLEMANDAETILLGRLNKVYHAPPAAAASVGQHNYQGPVGYVIE